jgi:hypothetical protein
VSSLNLWEIKVSGFGNGDGMRVVRAILCAVWSPDILTHLFMSKALGKHGEPDRQKNGDSRIRLHPLVPILLSISVSSPSVGSLNLWEIKVISGEAVALIGRRRF